MKTRMCFPALMLCLCVHAAPADTPVIKQMDGPSTLQISKIVQTTESLGIKAANLGRFETRHGTIIIHAGSEHQRYTVLDKSGRESAANLDEKQLQTRFPALYKAIEGAVANYDKLDASVYQPAPNITRLKQTKP